MPESWILALFLLAAQGPVSSTTMAALQTRVDQAQQASVQAHRQVRAASASANPCKSGVPVRAREALAAGQDAVDARRALLSAWMEQLSAPAAATLPAPKPEHARGYLDLLQRESELVRRAVEAGGPLSKSYELAKAIEERTAEILKEGQAAAAAESSAGSGGRSADWAGVLATAIRQLSFDLEGDSRTLEAYYNSYLTENARVCAGTGPGDPFRIPGAAKPAARKQGTKK